MVMINAKQVILYFESCKLSVKLQNHYVVNDESVFSTDDANKRNEKKRCAFWFALLTESR